MRRQVWTQRPLFTPPVRPLLLPQAEQIVTAGRRGRSREHLGKVMMRGGFKFHDACPLPHLHPGIGGSGVLPGVRQL